MCDAAQGALCPDHKRIILSPLAHWVTGAKHYMGLTLATLTWGKNLQDVSFYINTAASHIHRYSNFSVSIADTGILHIKVLLKHFSNVFIKSFKSMQKISV